MRVSLVLRSMILASGLSSGFPALAGPPPTLAIVGAKIYVSPSAPAIGVGTVIVRGDRIVSVGPSSIVKAPPRASIIEGRGHVVTAGFWNCHVHILTHELLHADRRTAAELSDVFKTMLNRWGFTTVFDVASVLRNTDLIRDRIGRGEVKGPAILTVGEPFYPRGGTPAYVRQFFAEEHLASDEVTSISEALARERAEFADGADGVKLFTGSIVGGEVGVLPMPIALAKALVDQAHRYGKPAFAHPSNAEGVEIAIDAGVDVLAHTAPMMGPWNEALIQRMRRKHMALVPTLTLFEVEAKKFGETDAEAASDMDTAIQQLHAFSSAGGDVLFGTDVGYTDAFDTSDEYRLMSRAGLDYRAILASLTTTPARRFQRAGRNGRIARGMDADLVILDGDPATDVTVFARVLATISRGKVIFEAAR